jgi:hypothetical protein
MVECKSLDFHPFNLQCDHLSVCPSFVLTDPIANVGDL